MAARATCAFSHDFTAAIQRIVNARLTVKLFASFADEEGDGAAKHALEVNKFVPVHLAEFLSVSQFHRRALLAQKIFLVHVLSH